ncbi:hypothetical protein [Alicyclobacillus pomorum]|uniref:hypothetical protein n=1 Tax=Alicyclobacillus pomorum TaxID=204470 RepID=UPI0012EC4080|nr:hypothetical protein [Alicyclobacillus pomorum]
MIESDRRTVVVPVSAAETEASVTVDDLLGQLRRVVKTARASHPDLSDYRLYDVALCAGQKQRNALLDFRP